MALEANARCDRCGIPVRVLPIVGRAGADVAVDLDDARDGPLCIDAAGRARAAVRYLEWRPDAARYWPHTWNCLARVAENARTVERASS
jgi:hypothetical protein